MKLSKVLRISIRTTSSDDNYGTSLSQNHHRCIVHLDADCFYAQVEMLYNPELRNKPLGIQQKNIIVTTNYLARQLGVPKSTYVVDAVKKWPELVLVNGEDLTKYRQKSYEISEFLQKYSPKVERLGFDENFIDVSELVSWRLTDNSFKTEFIGHLYHSSNSESPCECGCCRRLQIASQIASDIREALEKELGITSSAGIAHNKMLAKLIGARHKPNQQTTILPANAIEFMSSFHSVRCIPGIGLSTGNTLQKLGISSVVDLQKANRTFMEKELGASTTDFLVNCSFGVDESAVVTFGLPQSMSDEDSFQCCNNFKDAQNRIKGLIQSLLKRLQDDGRVPQTLRLTVRRASVGAQTWDKYRKRESRQCTFPRTVDTDSVNAACELLMPILTNLFTKIVDVSRPFHLTLINICFANFVKNGCEKKSNIKSYFAREGNSPVNNFYTQKKEYLGNLHYGDCYSHLTDTQCYTTLERTNQDSLLYEKSVLETNSVDKKANSNLAVCSLLQENTIEPCTKERSELPFEFSTAKDESDLNLNTLSVFQKAVKFQKRPAEAEVNQETKFQKNELIAGSSEFSESRKLIGENFIQDTLEELDNKYIRSPLPSNEVTQNMGWLECSQLDKMNKTNTQSMDIEHSQTDKKWHIFSPKSCSKNVTKLPAGIDPSVFSELPRNIQSEVLAHIAMASSPKVTLKKSQEAPNKNTKSNKNGKEKKGKDKGTSGILKYLNRNT
ncbi:hypothetical protein Btru_034545 [Bulinus truncatus]|nr:hypothetical protein Btru_034545 [Bulinus truncatus]